MTERMRLAVEVFMENGQFKAEVVNSEQATKKLGETGKQSFGALGEAAARVDGPIGNVTRSAQGLLGMTSRLAIALYGTIAALTAWGAAALKGTAIAAEHERELKRLEAQVRATGMAAGRSAEQLDEQAQQLSRITLFDDNEIRKAQGILLTFKSVTGEFFDATIKTAADLAEIMGTDLSSAVLQLGKALEDPEQGLTALTRSGVSFNATQKETIRNFVDTGEKGKALAMILETINGQLGPTSTAAAEGYAGAMHRVAESWEDFLESLAQTDTMTWWLEKIDRALQGLSRLSQETERQEFDRLFAERQTLLQAYPGASAAHINAQTNNALAVIEGRMAQLQDREVARQKGAAGAPGGGGGSGGTGRPTTEYEQNVRDQIRAFNQEIIEGGLAERDALQATIDKYDELGAAQRERTADLIALNEAANRGDEQAIAALNMIAAGVENVEDSADKAASALDVFGDQAGRNIHDIGVELAHGRTLGEGFFQTMLNGLADLAIEIAVSSALRSIFGGTALGGFLGIGGPAVSAPVGHAGGVFGQDALPTRNVPAFVFAGAPRYHDGFMPPWLGPGEKPAILKDDEGVFTPAQMRALGGRSSLNITVNSYINAPGADPAQLARLPGLLDERDRRLTREIFESIDRGYAPTS